MRVRRGRNPAGTSPSSVAWHIDYPPAHATWYLAFLLSVAEDELLALRTDATCILRPGLVVGVPHQMGYGLRDARLGSALTRVIDDGVAVSDRLWHPFREPLFHAADAVPDLYRKLAALRAAVPGGVATRGTGARLVVDVFRHAAEQHNAVASFLEPPIDAARAERVRIPFDRELAVYDVS